MRKTKKPKELKIYGKGELKISKPCKKKEKEEVLGVYTLIYTNAWTIYISHN